MVRNPATTEHERPDVAELPKLTSDPIVYGGPQGWNPHLFRT